MKLSRVRIDQFRQFRQPVTLSGLEPGINLFTGPNEAGKSTLVAAIRAAFFERHRSSSVDDFRPWGDSAATPTIEVDFTVGGVEHRLTKTFLGKKRCELQAGARHLDGASAEDHLAQLLGFQHATRGASGQEHWGIPGLLWIQQGSAHELDRSVAHATGHLRTALNESLGEVASNGGDDLLAQVEVQRNELLTPSTGTPRGAYADALKAEAALASAIDTTAAEVALYRDKVDTLASQRAEQAADEVDPPWTALRLQEAEARRQHEAASGVQSQLTQAHRRATELDAHVAVLKQQAAAFLQQQSDVSARSAQLDAARQSLPAVLEAVQRWQQSRNDAAERCNTARQQLRDARQHDARQAITRDLDAAQTRCNDLAAQLERAERAHAALVAAQQQAQSTALTSDTLATLRDQQRQVRELRIQQRAAATGLRFMLDAGASAQIGDDTVSGSGERRLVDTTRLQLPGLGHLEITPGGADLPALRRREQSLADAHAAQLQRLGLPTLEAAEASHQAAQQHAADEKTAAATLKAIAPKGLDALRADHHTLRQRVSTLTQSLDALPAPDQPGVLPSAAQAEAADEAARQSLSQAEQQLARAELQTANAQAAVDAAAREHTAALARLDAPERAERLAANHAATLAAQTEQHTHAAHVAALESQLALARPEILAQDVERFRRSAEQLEKRFTERREALLRLDAELQAVGAQGLDERQAEQTRDLTQLQRRIGELRQRAAALDHLLKLLKHKRRTLTRRLQAPLQRHLQHYLTLLFPQATLEIDDNLTPGPLTRPGPRGPQAGAFSSLSFGAREQMGVISRLAYADLLKEAGRPTLVILDDALVHSDDQRLGQMKRVLFDAATRHQILLFTCHPALWRDLGVTPRSLQDLKG